MIRKRKFANRLFPILDEHPVDENNLARSMRKLQKTRKSMKSIVDDNASEFVDFTTIAEDKPPRKSISPYEDIVKIIRRESLNTVRTKYIAFIVHGLDGNPFDMRHIRAALQDSLPDCSIFLINNNFKLTKQDINIQAKRLALEVKEVLNYMNFFGTL